jgi:hypothetical protein
MDDADPPRLRALRACDRRVRYLLVVDECGSLLCAACVAGHRAVYAAGYARYGWRLTSLEIRHDL